MSLFALMRKRIDAFRIPMRNPEAKRVMDLDHPVPVVPAEVDFGNTKGSGKYVCPICGYVYDPAEHEGVAFEDLPEVLADKKQRLLETVNRISMKKYLFIIKTQIIKSLTYEFNVYGNIIMQAIIMITSAYFWRALYKEQSTVGGVDADSMLTYVIISSALSVLLITGVERRIGRSVEKGTVAADMIKPVSLFGMFFAEDIGSILALILQNMLPILLIGSVMIKVPVMADVRDLPLLVVSVLESFLINWLIAALFGMTAFTAVNINALIQVKKHLIRLLSGSIIPIWFFPGSMAKVLSALPFIYIYQLPLSIYIGRGTRAEHLMQMRIQFLWLLILSALFFFVHNRVTRKVMVQGG